MPVSYNDKWVKCPYYSRDDSNGIICEGVQEGTALRLMFNQQKGGKDVKAKMDYMHRFCMEDYYNCLVCEVLDNKYE